MGSWGDTLAAHLRVTVFKQLASHARYRTTVTQNREGCRDGACWRLLRGQGNVASRTVAARGISVRGNVPPQPRSRKADEQREAREAVEQREPVRPLGSQPQGEGRRTRTAPGIQPSLHHTKPSERERLAELGIRQIGQHPWSKLAERKLSEAAEAHDVCRPEAAAAGAYVRSRLAPPRSRACAPSGSRSPPLPSLAPSSTCAHPVQMLRAEPGRAHLARLLQD